MFFVYVSGLKGPVPQLWKTRPTNGAGASKPPLQEVELPGDYIGPLDLLVKLYPYKGPPDGQG